MKKVFNKRAFLLILFLAVVMAGIFLYEREGTRENLFNYFKARIIPEELNLSQETGLDLSNLAVENLGKEKIEIEGKDEEIDKTLSSLYKKEQEEVGQEGGEKEERKLSLEEIKKRLDEIEQKKNQIAEEVEKLRVLTEIQKNIKELSERIAEISEEINNLT